MELIKTLFDTLMSKALATVKTPEEIAVDKETLAEAREVIKQLNDNEKKVINLVVINGVTVRQAADEITIFRDDLVKAMKRLNINDMCSIINKAGALKGYKWHKKLYVQDTFIEYRELFYRQCAAKGYM